MRSQRLVSTRDGRSKLPPVVPAATAGADLLHPWTASLSKRRPGKATVGLAQVNQLLHDRDPEPTTAQQLRALAKKRVFDSHNSSSKYKTADPADTCKSRVQLTPLTRRSSAPDTSRIIEREIDMTNKALANVAALVEASSNQLQHLEQPQRRQVQGSEDQRSRQPVKVVPPPKPAQVESWQAGSTTLARYRRLVGTVARRNLVAILSSAAQKIADRRRQEQKAASVVQSRVRAFLVDQRRYKRHQSSAVKIQHWVRHAQQYRRKMKQMKEEQEQRRVEEQHRQQHKAARRVQKVYRVWRSEQLQKLQKQQFEDFLQVQQMRARRTLCILVRVWKKQFYERIAVRANGSNLEENKLMDTTLEEIQALPPTLPPSLRYTIQAPSSPSESLTEDEKISKLFNQFVVSNHYKAQQHIDQDLHGYLSQINTRQDHIALSKLSAEQIFETASPHFDCDFSRESSGLQESIKSEDHQEPLGNYLKVDSVNPIGGKQVVNAGAPFVETGLGAPSSPRNYSSAPTLLQPICQLVNDSHQLSTPDSIRISPSSICDLMHSAELEKIHRFLLKVAYRRRNKLGDAATLVQRAVRRFIKRQQAHRIDSAIKVQCIVRGFLARKHHREALYAELHELRSTLAKSWEGSASNERQTQQARCGEIYDNTEESIADCDRAEDDDDSDSCDESFASTREQRLECAFLPSRNGYLPPGVQIGGTGTQSDGRGLLTLWWWQWSDEKWTSNAPTLSKC